MPWFTWKPPEQFCPRETRLQPGLKSQFSHGLPELNRLSWRVHGLSGDRAGFYALTVQANWRVTFRFVGEDVELLDYLDYH